jgi:hypothetical protein
LHPCNPETIRKAKVIIASIILIIFTDTNLPDFNLNNSSQI